MLYPIPEPIEFHGDKAFALSLLKQVTLDNQRYICLEVERLAKQHSLGTSSLTDWIQGQMGDWFSYEGWLLRVHGVPNEETDPGHNYPYQPDKLKASRLAWVAQMINQLETQ